MAIPYLIYYIAPNENFGKQWTLSDIRERTEIEYDYYLCDCATLGHEYITFGTWDLVSRQRELESRIKDSKCELTIERMATSSDTLENDLRKLDPAKVTRFLDPALDLKFKELHSVFGNGVGT